MLSSISNGNGNSYQLTDELRTSYNQLKRMIIGSTGGSVDIFISYLWKLFRIKEGRTEMIAKLFSFVDEMGRFDVMEISLVESLIICSLFLLEIGHYSSISCSTAPIKEERLMDVLGNVTMEFSLHYSNISEVPPYFIKTLNEMKSKFSSCIEELDLLIENFNSQIDPPDSPFQRDDSNSGRLVDENLKLERPGDSSFAQLHIKRRRNDSVFSSSILSDGRCYQLDVNTNDFYKPSTMSQPIPIKSSSSSSLKKKVKLDRTIILMTPPHTKKCDIIKMKYLEEKLNNHIDLKVKQDLIEDGMDTLDLVDHCFNF